MAIAHAALPDHWMPLAMIARAQRWPRRRTARMASGTALAGMLLVAVGASLKTLVHQQNEMVGGALLATGRAGIGLSTMGRGSPRWCWWLWNW